jgi:uncharacterized protein
MGRVSHGAATLLVAAAAIAAAPAPQSDLPSDIPEKWSPVTAAFDFERREAMIPMRDGVRLHTMILIPKGVSGAPILLTRTPYGATDSTTRAHSSHLQAVLPYGDDVVSRSGYIRVYQDVRGKYGSEGSYVMNRPLRGPLNSSATDHSTDTWDTIEWLTHNVPEGNGRVGIIGTSYGGFLVLMALVDPHPALKVAVPIAPMVDTWRGDDWFHNGAFRQVYAADYTYEQTATRRSEELLWRGKYDEYDTFLEAVSAGRFAQLTGLDRLAFWQRLAEHPTYDAYWQQQALDRILAARSVSVPTMYVHGLWDQEDIYGAPATYAATRPKDPGDRDFLVIGPWNHGGSNRDGSALGALHFNGDTGFWFRSQVLQPFLDRYLKGTAPTTQIPPVLAYETGSDVWRRYDRWPQSCHEGCPYPLAPLYLVAGGGLSFARPSGKMAYDEYISDPAKPVPYRLRPMRPVYWEGSTWDQWLVDDQRNFAARSDVLVYTTQVLTAPVRIAGQPVAHLIASTSGSDADWVIKLIDVYPDEMPRHDALAGYQLMVAADIFRGRYRESLEHPAPIPPGRPLEYQFSLPTASHEFLPGHRIMIQVQSSWFPLYDRNPQTFVANIFRAKPADFRKATQHIYAAGQNPSRIELPLVPAEHAREASTP